MKRKDLVGITTLDEYDVLIAEKFAEWDEIRVNGTPGGNYMPDGYILNNLRQDIIRLRERRDKKFEPKIPGQTDLFGGEVMAERPEPDIVPMGWMNKQTAERKKAALMAQFAALSVG